MAEYIDRALVLREAERYEKGITVNIKAELKALPTEDAIERSKINKAIEEMENEVKFWSEPPQAKLSPSVKAVRDGKVNSYKHCLEILNKLIAESGK